MLYHGNENVGAHVILLVNGRVVAEIRGIIKEYSYIRMVVLTVETLKKTRT